jgi:AcrR family transcriptional regulator
MAPKIVDKSTKKIEILRAAMRLFAENGVVNTKMSHIAEAAGIGKGTIYEYFRSKEDIFAEAYELVFKGVAEKTAQVLASGMEPPRKLEMLVRASVEGFLGDGGEFAGIMMAFWSEGVRKNDERIIKIINLREIYAEYRSMISAILKEGVEKGQFRPMDTFVTASLLIGSMDGILLQCIMDPKIFPPEKAVDVLLDSFMNGIKV